MRLLRCGSTGMYVITVTSTLRRKKKNKNTASFLGGSQVCKSFTLCDGLRFRICFEQYPFIQVKFLVYRFIFVFCVTLKYAKENSKRKNVENLVHLTFYKFCFR